MPDAYLVVKWLHVMAATFAIGPLVVLPAWRALARSGAPEGFDAYAASLLRHATSVLVLPAIGILFVTGLAMVVGPLSEWDMLAPEGRWVLVGLALWLGLSAAAGFSTGVLRHVAGVRRGEATGRPRRLARELGLASWTALALAVTVEGVMVFQAPP